MLKRDIVSAIANKLEATILGSEAGYCNTNLLVCLMV